VHGVGLTSRRAAALRTGDVEELLVAVERVAVAVRNQVLRKHDRKLIVRHRDLAALLAMDERNRAAPEALPRHAPVAQAEVDALPAQRLRFQVTRDGIGGGLETEA